MISILFRTLVSTLKSRRTLALENLALRHQVDVLSRHAIRFLYSQIKGNAASVSFAIFNGPGIIRKRNVQGLHRCAGPDKQNVMVSIGRWIFGQEPASGPCGSSPAPFRAAAPPGVPMVRRRPGGGDPVAGFPERLSSAGRAERHEGAGTAPIERASRGGRGAGRPCARRSRFTRAAIGRAEAGDDSGQASCGAV